MPKVPAAYLEARRLSIVEAARRAFVQKGTQSTTMAEIAAEAGITPGAIYRYFPTKEDLIDCCLDATSAEVGQRWDQPVADTQNPLRELPELSRSTFSVLNDPQEREDSIIHLEHMLTLARDGDAENLGHHARMRRQIAAKVQARLDAAQTSGQLGSEFDTELLAEALIAVYWGARVAKLLDAEANTDGALEQVFRLLDAARIAHEGGHTTRIPDGAG